MSDKKKGFQPPSTDASTGDPPAGSQTAGSSGAAPGSRSAARRNAAPVKVSAAPQGPLERFRIPIVIGVVVVGILALIAVLMSSATAAPYTCTTLMTPAPVAPAATPAPAPASEPASSMEPGASAEPVPTATPGPTPRLGFAAQDMGQGHVSESTSVTYAYCPPTSGQHFSSSTAPLPRRFYGPSDSVRPGNWVHNLEHGFVVILYKGEPDADTLAKLRTVMDEAPGTDFTTQQCGLPNKVIVARFDDMTTPFAAVSWDHALLQTELDTQALATYAEQSQESDVWPEKGVC